MALTIDFQSIGTYASNSDSSSLAPGAPAGVVTGNLLILASGNRSNTTVPTPTNWLLLSLAGVKVRTYGRIATGGGDDTPTVDWAGTNDSYAVILRYNGDVPADINDLLPASAVTEAAGTAGGNFLPLVPTIAPTGTDMLVFAHALKNKTGNSDGAVITTTPEFTLRGELVQSGSALLTGVGDWQQVGSAANYDGDDWTHDQGSDSLASANEILYFLPEAAAGGIVPQAMYHYRHHGD